MFFVLKLLDFTYIFASIMQLLCGKLMLPDACVEDTTERNSMIGYKTRNEETGPSAVDGDKPLEGLVVGKTVLVTMAFIRF
ncbi:unnamed protein product [Cylicostephanus goldi]|uniref:Uncharacterized protein n=1 Tax=Cylicostephanus goldi TaxID=71465 RepID=A0A3P7PVN6_CYLGO|nr:unnamed protein product [Cylicostephanus goldi]